MKKLLLCLLLLFPAAALAQTAPGNLATVNVSVVIVAGNTFQDVLAAVVPNNRRRSLTIQNNNAADSCWIFIGSAAATKATAILLLPGGSYTRYTPYIPSDKIQATCATTADTLYIDTQ